MLTKNGNSEQTRDVISSISAKALGRRIRQLRTQQAQTQQELGGEDYTKSYISAIEQGKTRPSLEALQRIATRLNVQAGTLLDPDASGFAYADPEEMPKRIRRKSGTRALSNTELAILDIIGADILLHRGRPTEALNSLSAYIQDNVLLQEGQISTGTLTPTHFQRACYLAAKSLVQLNKPDEAIPFINKSLEIERYLGNTEGVERSRNLLGECYYLAEQPLSALEHHNLCTEAIRNSMVHDPILKLSIFRNIANDYRALQQVEKAQVYYGSAIDQASQIDSAESLADALWKVALGDSEKGDFAAAKAIADNAVAILHLSDNLQLIVETQSNFGEELLNSGDLINAASYLHKALTLAERVGSNIDRAAVIAHLARLEFQQGDTNSAEQYVSKGLQLIGALENGQSYNVDNSELIQIENAEIDTGVYAGEEVGLVAPEYDEIINISAKVKTSKTPNAGRIVAKLLILAGEIAAERSDTIKADVVFREAVVLIESFGSVEERSDTYQRYARILMERGEHKRAAEYFEQAYRITRGN